MRRVFTPTVTGTVIMMIAATTMPVVFEMLETPDGYSDQAVQASTVATLIGFLLVALRGPGAWRLWAPAIGVILGSSVALCYGLYDTKLVAEANWFGLPTGGWPGLNFSFGGDFLSLLPAFIVITLVGAVETMGESAAIQRVSWRRPRALDCRAVQGAVAADGVGNLISGLFATIPNTTYSTSVAVVALTGVAARRVGVYIGVTMMTLAVFPKALALFIAIPDAVAAAYLMVPARAAVRARIEITMQDGIDFRKAIIVGISFWVGSGFENQLIFHHAFGPQFEPLLSNGMVTGGLCAIGLTLLVEATGARPRRTETDLDIAEISKIHAFLDDFAKRHGWNQAMRERLHSVSEEAVHALTEQADADADAEKKRLRVIARKDETGAELEFLAGSASANLEDTLTALDSQGQAVERELSLRLLQHFASSVRHNSTTRWTF